MAIFEQLIFIGFAISKNKKKRIHNNMDSLFCFQVFDAIKTNDA